MGVAPRSEWSKRPMSVPSRAAAPYLGVAVHWPGDGLSLEGKPHSACLEAMRAIENYQMDHAGYGAIAYQVIACYHGVLTEGRGVTRRNGANGDDSSNARYGSCLALFGVKEHPNDLMLAAIRRAPAYLKTPLKLFTHNAVRPEPTACPGPDLTAWIKAGYPPPEDDDMDWSDETTNLVTREKATFGQLIRQSHLASVETFNLITELSKKGGVDAAVVEAAVRNVFADAATPD